jgi:hypothetical protein
LGPALRRNASFPDVVAGLEDGSGRGGDGGGGVVVVVELGGGEEGRRTVVVVGVVGVVGVMKRPLCFVITGAGTVCSGIETLIWKAVVVQWLYCTYQYDL